MYDGINTLTQSNSGGEAMEFNENFPIYIQIMNLLKSKIVAGEIAKGGKLPSVRDFSKELKVNPNTVQRTYQELEREGLVFTQRGMGTFVTEDRERIDRLKKGMANNIILKFMDDMERLGFDSKEIIEIIVKWIEGRE